MKLLIYILISSMLVLLSRAVPAQIISPKKILNKSTAEKAKEILKGKDQAPEKEDAPEEEATDEEQPDNAQKQQPPSMQTYSRFDFVPGEKIIYFEDFSQDNIGEFPLAWNTNGSAEVVTNNRYPGKWLKFTGISTRVWTDKLIELPENCTIEFDIIPISGENDNMDGYYASLIQAESEQGSTNSESGNAGIRINCEYYGRVSYYSYNYMPNNETISSEGIKEAESTFQKKDQLYHIAISIQKSRVRVYQNENKFFDLPKALQYPNMHVNRLIFSQGAAMVSNIRMAAGNPDTRSKLVTEGKLVTYGINFDVNKDQLKPESYGTLKSIADVLKENPTLRIKIIGHTDGDGSEDTNLELSKKRAASVKRELTTTFGIETSRMETDGKGKTVPLAPNDTPSNKALNRRVEFIRL